ncbi:MAG: alpha/beta hydrolase [Myxococcota bacterium]
MTEKTAPFELGAGDDACLLLHGFTGSPWDVRPLGEALALRGYYVKAIRLPGHGSTPEALTQVGHHDWEQAAEDALLSLKNFRQVFVGGLSMGALLAVLLAARFPERVHGLCLMAPAMRLLSPSARVLQALGVLPLVELWRPWIPKDGTDIDDPEARAQAPVLEAFPSSRLFDLWRVQQKAREAMGQVRAPTLIAVAQRDKVVAADGGRELARGLTAAPVVRFIQLSEGAHVMPRDKGKNVLVAEVGEFFDRLRT